MTATASRGTQRRAPSADTPVRAGRTGKPRVEPIFYAFLFPAIALFSLAITLPALIGMFYSVTDYVGFGEYDFIGFGNYAALFTDPRILSSYGFTMGFSLVTVIAVNAIALALAIGLNSKIKFKTALRGIFFIPMVISGIVIAYVFNYLFSNTLPTLTGTGSLLVDPNLAWLSIVIVTAWQSIPSAIIIYLAGLLAIPEEVYEAGSLDGATGWRQFTSITLPLVAGYVVINTVLGFKGFLNAYEIIVGLTNGGPGTATFSVAMTIFTGFTSGDYAYQMANAVIFFIVTVVVSILQLQLIRRRGVSL
ncbi:carbohydrate ABC transporter permease [Microbacteriaceae bacterium 4G12]